LYANKQKYAFFSKKKQDDPGYAYVETSELSISEFKKLKTYLEKLIGIASTKNFEKLKGEHQCQAKQN